MVSVCEAIRVPLWVRMALALLPCYIDNHVNRIYYYAYRYGPEAMKKKARDSQKSEAEAALFKALADPTRLGIVKLLCHRHDPEAQCVNALAGELGITQSAVSQHLRILKNVGLVRGERRGYRVHYAIDFEALKRFHETALGIDCDK